MCERYSEKVHILQEAAAQSNHLCMGSAQDNENTVEFEHEFSIDDSDYGDFFQLKVFEVSGAWGYKYCMLAVHPTCCVKFA